MTEGTGIVYVRLLPTHDITELHMTHCVTPTVTSLQTTTNLFIILLSSRLRGDSACASRSVRLDTFGFLTERGQIYRDIQCYTMRSVINDKF